MLSACLTCKSAGKPKECGAGQVFCQFSHAYMPVMGLCPEFQHIAFRTLAQVGSVPLLDGLVKPCVGVSTSQPNLNGRLTLVEENPKKYPSETEGLSVPPPYNNRGTRDNLSFTGPFFSQCETENGL